jgi:hypothetical protein
MNATTTAPTSRSPWPYAIAGYFALAVIAIIIFVIWILPHKMDLVRPDYYEHEILFQKQIDAVNRTRPFAKDLAVAYDPLNSAIIVSLPANHVGEAFSGKAHLYRPSDAKLDVHIDLKPTSTGKQLIETSKLAPGLWKVRLEWLANGQAFAFEQSIIVGG